jgi:hypothetical protein
VLAGGLVAPGQRSLFLGDPGCGLSSVQGSLGSRLAVGDRRSRLGLEARGAPGVACAVGSPAYGPHLACLPASNNWSGLRCRVHGQAKSLRQIRPFSDAVLKAAQPMVRSGDKFLTFATRRESRVLSRVPEANVVGRKARDPTISSRVSLTSVSFHAQDAITDEHRTHASA